MTRVFARSIERARADVIRTEPDPGNDWTVVIDAVGPGGARGRRRSRRCRDAVVPPGGRRAQPVERDRRRRHRLVGRGGSGRRRGDARGIRRRPSTVRIARLRSRCRLLRRLRARPVELAVTLDVARRTGPRRLMAVFQPHRYSRTQALWRELGSSLSEADRRRGDGRLRSGPDPDPRGHGKLVVDGSPRCRRRRGWSTCRTVGRACEFLGDEVRAGDLVITMGCGDVWMLGDATLERIREAS